MARGRHYAKLSLSNAARLSFSDLCILLFLFLSLCRLCVCAFLCSHWSLVDVPLIFFSPADHVPDWQPRVLLGMVEARSVNVKKTTTTTYDLELRAPKPKRTCQLQPPDFQRALWEHNGETNCLHQNYFLTCFRMYIHLDGTTRGHVDKRQRIYRRNYGLFHICMSGRSTPVAQLAPRNLLTRWDVSSIPANGIFRTKN